MFNELPIKRISGMTVPGIVGPKAQRCAEISIVSPKLNHPGPERSI